MAAHKVYVASSWRNSRQPQIVSLLRMNGHDVYDFRHPRPGNNGFKWDEIDPNWTEWDVPKYRTALQHPLAEKHFGYDMEALGGADVVVLLLPSGRSAHSEAAWHKGHGKPVVIHSPEMCEPELMYKMFDIITAEDSELVEIMRRPFRQLKTTPPPDDGYVAVPGQSGFDADIMSWRSSNSFDTYASAEDEILHLKQQLRNQIRRTQERRL